ncbi:MULTISPECIES: FAD/NAD(P)-binding protein [Acinetobacter]|uniref:FAD/NAD(P)-binding protein n=1 Tax=Acinetobacter TaxID=469 RepID=UPI00061FBF44|nr:MULTISPECIES: FAD/NAD(P)-binding protein [Acinetobacter]KKC44638.1 hypothetical protein UC75_03490 [Acinetobacter sp. V2]
MRVLQIGAGPTGVCVFRQIYPVLKQQNEILDYVIADDKEPGKGLAFGSEINSHILNLPASIMSLDPSNPLEFCEWRSSHESFWNDGSYNQNAWSEFPPRRLFGEYVSSLMQKLLLDRPSSHLIKKKVVSIHEIKGPNKFFVEYDDGVTELFDKVILCLGHSPLKPLFDEHYDKYKHSPYELKSIPSYSKVGIIGTRLTAIDAVLALREQGHKGEIFLASRSGMLPKVFHEKKKEYDSKKFISHLLSLKSPTLSEIIDLHKAEIMQLMSIDEDSLKALLFSVDSKESFNKELDLLGINSEWQSVLLASYCVVDQLWQKLTEDDKNTFLNKYYGIWMTYLAAYPEQSAKIINNMMNSNNQLHLIGGVQDFNIDNDKCFISLENGKNIDVDYLIDGRGVGYTLEDFCYSPLLKSLIDNRLVEPHPNGGLKVDINSYEANTHEGIIKNLHIIGDLTKGVFLSTTDVGRCVDHSSNFLKYLENKNIKVNKVA